ncbi:MAG: phospholipase D-like domain-containing protein [Anaerolineae bacterium]|nr:phospholipase D-like domain-containing protein [Anaerolineae bacterium]MDK1080656.1 phospholipase D-like domain-containing protein [Anaerolineae bacterium]MDK1118442.1 phospholipase D-like domain-containing protein [Anaerolineae bacterium]
MKQSRLIKVLILITLLVNSGCGINNPGLLDNPDGTETPEIQVETTAATELPKFELIESQLPAGYSAHGPWIDIYFTNPESPQAAQETGGIEGPLVAAIDRARLTVDVAIYSLSLASIRKALINAQNRGVQVRVVMESGNMDRSAPQKLIESGVPVLGDRRDGLMHDKFVVIDRSDVWMGTMNFTYSGTYKDNNQLIHIRSVKVAENYTQEFNEMFVDDLFGANIAAVTPNQEVTINGTKLEVYFSPDDGVANRIVEILENAEESIYFMAFSFTSDEIGQAMRVQAENGLIVAGVMEERQVKSNIGTEYDFFKQARLDVFIDGNQEQMHHKTIIIDEKIVITGSYNFSRSAEIRNDENVIIFHNEIIAEFFIKEFQRVFQQAQQ